MTDRLRWLMLGPGPHARQGRFAGRTAGLAQPMWYLRRRCLSVSSTWPEKEPLPTFRPFARHLWVEPTKATHLCGKLGWVTDMANAIHEGHVRRRFLRDTGSTSTPPVLKYCGPQNFRNVVWCYTGPSAPMRIARTRRNTVGRVLPAPPSSGPCATLGAFCRACWIGGGTGLTAARENRLDSVMICPACGSGTTMLKRLVVIGWGLTGAVSLGDDTPRKNGDRGGGLPTSTKTTKRSDST